jgi:SSS family solute:Na+ symporter
MITGGTTTISLVIADVSLPFNLDANIFGISASAVVYLIVNLLEKSFNGK